MDKIFEVSNFSFRDGEFCIYLKDYINNIHTVLLNNIVIMKNYHNNVLIKLFYGKLNNYIGELHVFFTDFIGLYNIYETPELEFYEYYEYCQNEKEVKVFDNLNKETFIKNLHIFQVSEYMFVIIYYPYDKILEKMKNQPDEVSKFINNLNLFDIFNKGLNWTLENYIYLSLENERRMMEQILEERQLDYQRSQENLEYQSIYGNSEYESLDSDDKRGMFGEEFFFEQLFSYDGEIEKDDDDIRDINVGEKFYYLLNKFDNIIITNCIISTEKDYPDYILYITLLIPPKRRKASLARLVNIKLYPIYFTDGHTTDYYSGEEENIFVIAVSKDRADVLEMIQKKLDVSSDNFQDYNNYFIYIQIFDEKILNDEINKINAKLKEIENNIDPNLNENDDIIKSNENDDSAF